MPEPTEKGQPEEKKPEETSQEEPEVSPEEEEEARLQAEEAKEAVEQEKLIADLMGAEPSAAQTGDDQPSEEPEKDKDPGKPAGAEETPKEPTEPETPEGGEKPKEPGKGKEDEKVLYSIHFPEGVEQKTPEQLVQTARQHRFLARRHQQLKPLLDVVKSLESVEGPGAEQLRDPQNIAYLLRLGVEAAQAGWRPGDAGQPQVDDSTFQPGHTSIFADADEEEAVRVEMPETYKKIVGMAQTIRDLQTQARQTRDAGTGHDPGEKLDPAEQKVIAEMNEVADTFFKVHANYFNSEDKTNAFTSYVRDNFGGQKPKTPKDVEKTLKMALMGYDSEYFGAWFSSDVAKNLKTEDPKRGFGEGSGSRGVSASQLGEQEQHIADLFS